MDLIFYLFVTSSWMSTEDQNTVWNNLKGAHGFSIFCSVVITILKANLTSFRSPFSTSSKPSENLSTSNDHLLIFNLLAFPFYL
jgi:hypothetical protein